MQFMDSYEMPEAGMPAGLVLSADDVSRMIALMQELRDVTLSRATFSAAGEVLAQLGDASARSRLVPHDVLEH